MKKLLSLSLLLTLFTLQNCNIIEDCKGIDCMTPPDYFYFELIDITTEENLFTNGTFKPDNIKVINSENNSPLDFDFVEYDNLDAIQIHSFGWQTEKVTALLMVENDTICSLYVDAQVVNKDCCTFTRFHEINIGLSEYLDEGYLHYKILIE